MKSKTIFRIFAHPREAQGINNQHCWCTVNGLGFLESLGFSTVLHGFLAGKLHQPSLTLSEYSVALVISGSDRLNFQFSVSSEQLFVSKWYNDSLGWDTD